MHVVARAELEPPRAAMLATDPEDAVDGAPAHRRHARRLSRRVRRVARRSGARVARRRRGVSRDWWTTEPADVLVRRLVVAFAGGDGEPRVSFLAPLWLGAAALGARSAWPRCTSSRRGARRRRLLPTARFVPVGDARASSRAARPTDLPLLALRCAALLLVGAAFAGPVTRAGGSARWRAWSWWTGRGFRARRRARLRARARAGGRRAGDLRLRRVDRDVGSGGLPARAHADGRARGSLSAALVGARRAAGDLARGADSVELVIVSPLTTDELDAASAELFARWPGRARLVRTGGRRARRTADVTLVSGDPDDALRPAIATLNARDVRRRSARAAVRVVRDRAVAAGDSRPRRWPARRSCTGRASAGATPSAEGLWAGGATLVAPLARLSIPEGGRVVARWADGERAAAERPAWPRVHPRRSASAFPTAGDVTLQPAFVAVARFLLAPCDGAAAGIAAADSVATSFARAGPAATAAALRSRGRALPARALAARGAACCSWPPRLFVRRAAEAQP